MMSPNYPWATARETAIKVFILIPIISLSAAAIAWLRYGIDLPRLDDWRAYIQGNANSLDLTYLFTSANDTLYPVGKVLDVLAQRYLDGNSVAYQFLSMTIVLGLLLGIQWRLLSLALKDRLLAASAFAFTVFMIQPGSYWGHQSLAYHQSIPLVCLLGSLAVILGPSWSRLWGPTIVAALGLLAGLTYISGAFGAVAAAVVLLSWAPLLSHEDRQRFVGGGTALLVSGALTAALQVRVILVVQHGHTHRPDAPWALPTQSDFWLYMLGKIARAASLHELPTATSSMFTLLVIALVLALLSLSIWHALQGRMRHLRDARVAIIFVTLAAIIATYLFMVVAGRANLHSPKVDTPSEVFALGIERFHFFWVTLLWPWLAASLLSFARKANTTHSATRVTALALMLPLIILPVAALGSTFRHFDYQKSIALRRSQPIACLQESLRRGDRIFCPALFPADLTKAYLYALTIGASFTRIFQLPKAGMGVGTSPPLFRLSTAVDGTWRTHNIAKVERTARGLRMEPIDDPMIFFRTGSPLRIRKCTVLEVGMLATTKAGDVAKLYYRVPGQRAFSEGSSTSAPVQPSADGGLKNTLLQVTSPFGFEDDFRLDPVVDTQPVTVKEIELRCRG